MVVFNTLFLIFSLTPWLITDSNFTLDTGKKYTYNDKYS
jgi:hypothetical protein